MFNKKQIKYSTHKITNNIKILFFLFFLLILSCTSSKDLEYVGYTNGMQDGKKGITTFFVNSDNGSIRKISFIPTLEAKFMNLDKQKKYLFISGKTKKGSLISGFKIKSNHSLEKINSFPSKESGPCHISVEKNNKYLLTSDYGGTISAWQLNKNKQIIKHLDTKKLIGSSINKKRQKSSHPHSSFISPDNQFILIPDLGADKVHIYKMNKNKLKEKGFYKTSLGGGPRHLAFSPNGKKVYILNELSSTIEVCNYNSKTAKLKNIQKISTLNKNFTEKNKTAEILVHPSGQYLYASNRGADTIVVFKILANGKLKSIQQQSTFGKIPRNFNLSPDGKILLVANRISKNLVVFKINSHTGKLKLLKINKWNNQIWRVVL